MSPPRLNTAVFVSSAGAIVLFTLWTVLAPDAASAAIQAALGWISGTFGWFYVLAVVGYLVFVIGIAVSPLGRLRLGPADATPEYPLLSWAAMLFAAGIGIDLLFFCVAEPVSHFLVPPLGEGGSPAAARRALELTFLHWGLSGWGVYTLVGMCLAFFAYRRGLPLTIRSALHPLLGARSAGLSGHAVDVAAVLATVFGIAASLGIGILQLAAGMERVFDVAPGRLLLAALAALVVAAAGLSAALGVDRGIRRLSEFNMLLAAGLLVFVLLAGDTLSLLGQLAGNAAGYLGGFIALSFHSYGADAPPRGWLNAWTIFFWAWWIAWGPFVGLFLARISRGRTIRSFVAGTLILPLVFMMGWMSVMGNSAIELVTAGAEPLGAAALENPGAAIYEFLQYLPWPALTAGVVSVLALVFFVTSGDSGALVLANFTSHPVRDGDGRHRDGPVWLRLVWAGVIGALTLALLLAGGLVTLQSAVVVMGLPFAVVLCLMAWGLLRALREER
jgi:choline/glycine/proline betaine transport protein